MNEDEILVDGYTSSIFGVGVPGPQILKTHSKDKCVGRHCVIHNPSDHHMRDWDLHWRADKGQMERICPHGIGHPDPDQASFNTLNGNEIENRHGCDGCCQP